MRRITHILLPGIIALLTFSAAYAKANIISSQPASGLLPDIILRHIDCRIVHRVPNDFPVVLADANINTLSKNPKDFTLNATSADGHTFTAAVWHVPTAYPTSRFWVTIQLDGKPLIRVTHIDMIIWFEWTHNGNTYALHCDKPVELPEDELMEEMKKNQRE
ncbi:MAG: hypothetical protein A2X94_15525 [Bdellovibrionales bacterium GWB1_55_8]|nr:MAG: hypothetical protein A2X94_15525 [Bdellovibrionales bacterium GWB1_55_8]